VTASRPASDGSPVNDPIYLDHNATTPVDAAVLDAMLPFLREGYGNPSSSHPAGRRARAAVAQARAQVAGLIGGDPAGLVFTSGGTEANNHALIGAMRAAAGGGAGLHGGIVTSNVEHPAVSEVCRWLAGQGCRWTQAPVDRGGRVAAGDVAAAAGDGTVIVSVMHANNETGAVQPVAAIGALLRGRGVLLHTDAAQSAGKIPLDADELGVDLVSLAGHKLYAPKGVGALWIRPGAPVANLMFGAGHEGGRRPGTENVASVVGLGVACELAQRRLTDEAARLTGLRDALQRDLLAAVPDALVHGLGGPRLPNTLSIGFAGATADAIIANLPEVSVSAGAACHAEGVSVSHVLQAMQAPLGHAAGTLRLSLGRGTTQAQMETAAAALVRAVATARAEA
jgi:cysteine desulfurase